ncbi:MAG: hypothetical protein Q9188_000937 [Gyalolechia gomerana]
MESLIRLTTLRRIAAPLDRRPFVPITSHNVVARRLVMQISAHGASLKNPPLPTIRAAHQFQSLSMNSEVGPAEDTFFEEQVQDVKTWWESSRFKGITRSHTAEAVVSARGTLQQTYPSSLMAKKLFDLFQERAAAGEPVHTSLSDA